MIEPNQNPIADYKIVDEAYAIAKENSKQAAMFWIYLPVLEKNPLSIRAYHETLKYYAMDFYQFATNNNLKMDVLKYDNLSPGKKLSNAMYDLHTGLILGTFSKIIVFIASIIGTTLPITGIVIWLKRPKSKKKIQKT